MQESDRVEPTAGTSHAVVPVPGSAASEQPKRSFWQRISLRRAQRRLAESTLDDRVLARLDAIAQGLAGTDQRIEQLDQRFTEVWEVEEQLSRLMELREMLVDLRQRQARTNARLRRLDRRLLVITIFAGTAAAVGLAAIVLAVL
ncbi:MAG: hypothetical protein VCC20_06790 [Myxococcota bacterium]